MYRQEYKTLIIRSAFCYTAGSDKQYAIKEVSDRLLKRAVMVFMVDVLNF